MHVFSGGRQFMLSKLVGIKGGGFSVPDMIKRLALFSLTPLVVGKVSVSVSPQFAAFCTYFSKLLTYISSGVIIFQPWVTISRSTSKWDRPPSHPDTPARPPAPTLARVRTHTHFGFGPQIGLGRLPALGDTRGGGAWGGERGGEGAWGAGDGGLGGKSERGCERTV